MLLQNSAAVVALGTLRGLCAGPGITIPSTAVEELESACNWVRSSAALSNEDALRAELAELNVEKGILEDSIRGQKEEVLKLTKSYDELVVFKDGAFVARDATVAGQDALCVENNALVSAKDVAVRECADAQVALRRSET